MQKNALKGASRLGRRWVGNHEIADIRRRGWISLGEDGLGRVFWGGEVQLEGAVVGFWWISQDDRGAHRIARGAPRLKVMPDQVGHDVEDYFLG